MPTPETRGEATAATPNQAQETLWSAGVNDQPVDPEELAARVADDRAGATVSFLGVVRNHDGGRAVTGIEYSAHPTAIHILGAIAAEIAARPGIHGVAAAHRVGALAVGDVAMAVSVSAAHRAEAFRATADLVDEVKARLPVWKRQHFTDGESQWVGLA